MSQYRSLILIVTQFVNLRAYAVYTEETKRLQKSNLKQIKISVESFFQERSQRAHTMTKIYADQTIKNYIKRSKQYCIKYTRDYKR